MITTGFYLDCRRTSSRKNAPLKLSLNSNRKTAYINTGIKLNAGDWDADTQKAKSASLQHLIEIKKVKIDSLILELQEKGKLNGLSIREIRDLIQGILTPSTEEPIRFMSVLNEFASTRTKQRTKEIYQATAKKIEQFEPKCRLLDFTDITIGWLDRFDSFLAASAPKKNARNIHLRNIRAVFNYALKRDLTVCYPFRKYEIRPEDTPKRSLPVEDLRILLNAELPAWQQKYLDFFALSFMLIGINTEDLLHIKEITSGRIEYNRAKTYRHYSIKVEPEAATIIDKHRGEQNLINILDSYACTHNWTAKVNSELKKICKSLDIQPVSMYWARHSWATIAASLEIPKETIAAALGHSSSTVTDIYIDFDRSKIDRANRRVLDLVLYDKKDHSAIEILNNNIAMLQKRLAAL